MDKYTHARVKEFIEKRYTKSSEQHKIKMYLTLLNKLNKKVRTCQ